MDAKTWPQPGGALRAYDVTQSHRVGLSVHTQHAEYQVHLTPEAAMEVARDLIERAAIQMALKSIDHMYPGNHDKHHKETP